jgi:DNA-binding response OmpR family regulator
MPKAGILLVEDEPTSREILQYVLSEAGYPVDVSATAAAAHKQLGLISYGLVIADWQLPDQAVWKRPGISVLAIPP